MRISRQFLIALSALVLPHARSAAQTCHGTSSFSNGTVRVGASAQFYPRQTSYLGQLSFGAPRSWFASAEAGQTKVEGLSTNETEFAGSLGYQIPFSDPRLEFCPYALLGYTAMNRASNSTTWGFGGGMGYALKASASMDFVPALGIQWQSTSGPSGVSTANSTLVWLTTGVVLNKAWSITPGVLMPTRSGQDNILTLGLGYSWGK